MILEYRLCN